jgi:hypothetical protein
MVRHDVRASPLYPRRGSTVQEQVVAARYSGKKAWDQLSQSEKVEDLHKDMLIVISAVRDFTLELNKQSISTARVEEVLKDVAKAVERLEKKVARKS